MIKQQNIQLLYPNLQESQQPTVLKAYENETIQQFHVIVQQIKTKYAIPNSMNAVQFPNQDEVIEFFQNYKALLLDLNQIADVKIKLYKNAAYYGSLVDGLRQGQGVLIKQTLQVYEGSWVRDKKEGIGFEILKSNQFYHGNYVNGLPHGEGVFWSKNQKYIGQWQQGKKHGIGWYSGTQKDYYLGQWENGKCFGLCLHIHQDIYIGHVMNDLKHGQGEEYFENGDHFIGDYKNGKPNGYGEYYWSNGNFYKGQFVNGLRNGDGIWQNQTREGVNCYRGQYANDKKCGQGTFEYANGTLYNGYFVDDKRCGYGEMVWSDQATYKGYWQDGLMEGEGIYEFDGLILKGNWKSNQLQSFDKVRVSLNEFPKQHQLKKIKENEDVYSEMAEEPDKDEIGDQFQNDPLGSKVETVTQNISHNTSHHEMQFHSNKPQILQKQFDLLSLLDQGLQLQSIDPPQRQCSSVAIQTDSKKQFLPKLSIHKKTPTQYSYSVDPKNASNKFKFDSLSNSPNTRETDKSNKSNRVQTQKKPNRSVQCRGRRNKQILLSKKEQNIWAIKMNKLKLSPTRYCKLWNHEVVNEIKQFLYPPVWKPPSHLL